MSFPRKFPKASKKKPVEKLFAANLPYDFTADRLGELFDPFGLVISCRVVKDPETGESRGFGFVELAPDKARARAIAALNGTTVDGRKIEVRLAENKQVASRPAPARASGGEPMPYVAEQAFVPAAPAAAKRSVVVEYRRLSAQRFRTAS